MSEVNLNRAIRRMMLDVMDEARSKGRCLNRETWMVLYECSRHLESMAVRYLLARDQQSFGAEKGARKKREKNENNKHRGCSCSK